MKKDHKELQKDLKYFDKGYFEKMTHKIPYQHMQNNMQGENQPPVPTGACHHFSGQKCWSLCGQFRDSISSPRAQVVDIKRGLANIRKGTLNVSLSVPVVPLYLSCCAQIWSTQN